MSCSVPDSLWPVDRDAVTFLVMTRPDTRGRRDFYALFWSDGARRGLGFFGRNLDDQVRAARRKGAVVDVIEQLDVTHRDAA